MLLFIQPWFSGTNQAQASCEESFLICDSSSSLIPKLTFLVLLLFYIKNEMTKKPPLHLVLIQKLSSNLKASGMETKFEKLSLQLIVKQQWLGRQYRQFYLLSIDRGSTADSVSFSHGTFNIKFLFDMQGNVLRNMLLSDWNKSLLPNFCGICEGR